MQGERVRGERVRGEMGQGKRVSEREHREVKGE